MDNLNCNAAEAISQQFQQLHRSPGNIIVVDDQPANLKLLEEMLRQEGYIVRSFPRGRLAIAAAAQDPPDLVLLDINMPEMNGYEVCEQLKSIPALAAVPVIFISALDEVENRLTAFRLGGVDYISKPFHFEEVQSRVGAHIKLRFGQKQIEKNNRHLQAVVQQQVKKIADGHMATIFAIAKLADLRDDQTGRHLERIQILSRLLAEGLGRYADFHATVNDEWINNIFHASPLHDIGKVAVPDHILLKCSGLTPDEYAIMKTHTRLGAQTLREVYQRYPDNEFIAMGIDVAQSHHERWDGAGYPEGLRGQDIPLCARVLAVADCYDALRSKRCYKQPVSHRETCHTILENSGKQFDPSVVGVFKQLSDEIDSLWSKANALTQFEPKHEGHNGY